MSDIPPISAGTHPRTRPIDLDVSKSSENGDMIKHLTKERSELVERIRKEIAAGTYETADRMDEAIDRLEDELTNR